MHQITHADCIILWNKNIVTNNLLILVNCKLVRYKEIVAHLTQGLKDMWVL
jgi:hypothetical protein